VALRYKHDVRRQQLEARVLQIVDLVTSGIQVEDNRVEIKADWPDDIRKTARQIAGHANAAGGDEILWIIGLDERRHRLNAATSTEVQGWWSRVERCFSEVTPDLEVLNVPTPHGGSVVALTFETSRSPYLVTTGGNAPEREVPWRAGNGTRSAKRSEILQSVVGESQVPRLELVRGVAFFNASQGHPDGWRARQEDPAGVIEVVEAQGTLRCYLEASQPVTLPEHKWKGSLRCGETSADINLKVVGPRAVTGSSPSGGSRWEDRGVVAYVPSSGLHVHGSDAIVIRFRVELDSSLKETLRDCDRVDIHVKFPVALSTRAASLDVRLPRATWMGDDHSEPTATQLAEFTHDGQPFNAEPW
jgi:hypothetical protein